MPEDTTSLAARLQKEGGKTVEFFRSLPEDCWGQVVYADGAIWSIQQLLAHFVAAENGMQQLVRDVLSGGTGVPENFDLDRYNHRKVAGLENQSPAKLAEQFLELRGQTAALVAAMSPEDLQRPGRHPFLGMTTIEEILKLLYIHNQIHQRDIRRVVKSAEQG